MKRHRTNQGILALPATPMLVMEGSRHNFLPGDPFSSPYCKVALRGVKALGAQQHLKFPGVAMWTFEVIPGTPFHIELAVKCPDQILGYTFSTFASTNCPTPTIVKARLGDCQEAKCDNLVVTRTATRFEVACEFATSPDGVSVSLDGEVLIEHSATPVLIGFAFLTIEEGLFASSPIPPGDPIGFRDAERLSYKRGGNFFLGHSGTVSFFFSPIWNGPQLGEGDIVFLVDCIAADQQSAVSIYADGADYGKLKATIIAAGKIQTLSTDVIPVRGILYAVALRWAVGMAEVLVNGRSAATAQFDFPDSSALGENVFIGSTGRLAGQSAFATLSHVLSHASWLSDDQLRATIFEAYPTEFGRFMPDWERFTNAPQVELFKTEAWGFQFALVLLRQIPRLWQEVPPQWLLNSAIDESHCRDEVYRFLAGRDFDVMSEYTTFEGRTDLAIQERNNQERILRIEFKVWGRNDYKEIPEKPLKYFSDLERIAIVLMINPRKGKQIGDDYRRNVESSPTDVTGIIDKPFGDELCPDHFVSVHERAGSRAEVLHIVLNRQGPFAMKNLPEEA